MIKYILLIIIIPMITSCIATSGDPDYSVLAQQIVGAYAIEAKKNRGLSVGGYGGSMASDLKRVFVNFNGNQKIDVAQARRLYVEIIDGLLDGFNKNKEIRPYLLNYPFTYKNLEITLSFTDDQNHHMSNGYIAFVFISKKDEVIVYDSYDQVERKLYDIYEEPYNEAVRTLREEQSNSGD